MKKRLLSILLTFCMLLCLVPVSALADDTALRSVAVQNIGPNEAAIDTDLYEKMSAGINPIKLIADINLYGTLSISQEVIIDLNGHVLKMGDIGDGSVIKVNDGGHLTIIDSNPTAEHKFTPNADGLWVLDEASGTESVRGGVIYGGKSEKGGGVWIEPGGEFTMTGGSIVGCTATDPGHNAYGGGVYVAGTFKMTGGNIVGCTVTATTMWDSARGGGVYVTGTFTMSGGSIIGCTAVGVGQNAMAWGGAIRNQGTTILSDTAEIRDCHATGNSVDGGGISAGGLLNISGDVKIIGCTADGSSDAMSILYTESTISGGTFDGTVKNWGKITGGNFKKEVTNIDVGTITGGVFYGGITNQYGGKIDGLTVTYRVNKADYAVQVLQSGEKATKPTDPVTTTAGHDFSGWFTSEGATYDFSAAVTENLTLTGWLYVPVTNETELKAALADDTVDVIRLTSDIDISASLTILRKLTLDLNGHVLKMTGSGSVIILDDNNGTTTGDLTLIDSDPTAKHRFKVNGVEPWVLDDSGTEIVKGGVITGGNAENGGGVYVKDGGKFTMTAGNIVGCTAKYGGGLYLRESSFTMNGGNIVGCRADSYGGGVYLNGGTMNAGGGTVDGTVVLDVNSDGKRGVIQGGGSTATHFSGDVTNYGEIGHGTFSGTVTLGNSNHVGTITGGIFNGSVTTDSVGEAAIGGGVFNKTVTIDRGEITKGTFNKDVVVYNALGSFRGTTLTGGTYNGLIINKSAYAAFAGAHSPLGIVETKPSSAYSNDLYRTVTFDPAGGEMDYPVRYFFEDGNISSEIKPAPRTGYTFGGWYKADGTAWDYANDTVTENITLYAKWTPHTYTVTFDSTGGSEVIEKTMTATYGEQLGVMPVPIRLGYFFCGWYDALAGGKCYGDSDGKSTSQYDKTENCTLYAQWKIKQYTITFDTAGGSKIDSITQDYGTMITAPADPTREGYTFMGWDKKIPETMPAENITITAQWKDIEKPTGEIKISENSWKSFLNNITFGLFFKETQKVTITATDNSGETVKIEYLLSNKELTEAKLANAAFTVYTAPFSINPDNEYIIYVRLTDKTGNVSYICSDGIVLDGTSPVIKGIENGKTYCEAQTVTIDEKYVDTVTVTVNGTPVTLDENNSFVLSPANGEQKIIVTDKAGNTTEITVTINDGHTFGEWKSNGDGTHTRKCTVDGCNGSETKDCSGGKATCTEKARCEVCGEGYGNIDHANHADLKHFGANAATTAAEGNTEYWYCDGCGKYFADAAATKEITKADTVTERLPSSEKSPKTGNTGNLALWLAAAFIGGAACSAFAVKRRKTTSARR